MPDACLKVILKCFVHDAIARSVRGLSLYRGFTIKKKVKGHVWGLFGTAACRPIVPLPPMSSPHSSPEAPRTT